MLTTLKFSSTAALSVAIMSVALLGGVSSAQAAGCLQDGQALYSLAEDDDNDEALAANTDGFVCGTDGNVLAYTAPQQETVFDTDLFQAEPQARTSARPFLNDGPSQSLVSDND